MAGQLKLRRGTTSQLANFIGSEGELTYNTTLKSLVLHDGVTLGGVKIPYLSNNLVPSTMLPKATELVVGASKIATSAIAQAGVNDTDIITPLKLSKTRQSNWVNKTGMFFGTTYINSTSYDRDVSVISSSRQGYLTIMVVFTNISTSVVETVYFSAHANFSNPSKASACFTVPANTSYNVNIVDSDSFGVVTGVSVAKWSERHYV